jgi:hypothetical protein
MKLPNNVLPDTGIHTRKWLNSISGLSIVMIMYGVSGCASTVKFTPVDFCSQPVNPAMARIVMSRTLSMYGGAIATRIFDSGQPIGEIGSGGRLCWDRFPGKAVISKVAMDFPGEFDMPKSLRVETRANTTYYVKSSFTGQWKLTTEPD